MSFCRKSYDDNAQKQREIENNYSFLTPENNKSICNIFNDNHYPVKRQDLASFKCKVESIFGNRQSESTTKKPNIDKFLSTQIEYDQHKTRDNIVSEATKVVKPPLIAPLAANLIPDIKQTNNKFGHGINENNYFGIQNEKKHLRNSKQENKNLGYGDFVFTPLIESLAEDQKNPHGHTGIHHCFTHQHFRGTHYNTHRDKTIADLQGKVNNPDEYHARGVSTEHRDNLDKLADAHKTHHFASFKDLTIKN